MHCVNFQAINCLIKFQLFKILRSHSSRRSGSRFSSAARSNYFIKRRSQEWKCTGGRIKKNLLKPARVLEIRELREGKIVSRLDSGTGNLGWTKHIFSSLFFFIVLSMAYSLFERIFEFVSRIKIPLRLLLLARNVYLQTTR